MMPIGFLASLTWIRAFSRRTAKLAFSGPTLSEAGWLPFWTRNLKTPTLVHWWSRRYCITFGAWVNRAASRLSARAGTRQTSRTAREARLTIRRIGFSSGTDRGYGSLRALGPLEA